MHKLFFT